MKFRKLLFFPVLFLTLGLASCNQPKEIVYKVDETPITDSFKLAQADSLEGKRFAYIADKEPESDHYGYATLRSCTDGDTANFIQEDYKDEFGAFISIKTRFLGVNTPESTAKVEPWGKPASIFTKHQLEAAQMAADEATAKDSSGKIHHNIVLINHPGQAFDEKDSSGNRWLAFIWYRLNEQSDWRNLNLELVERAYSKNQLFVDDPVCNYRAKFEQAEDIAKKATARVHGEKDPGFDYEEKTYEYSLWYVINHYAQIGISDDGSSGVQLLVTALVVGIQGDNMFLRDVLHDREQDENDDSYAGLYAYAGYNSSLCSLLQHASTNQGLNDHGVGIVVRFYCRATMYSGNVQLSDVKSSSSGKKAFKTIIESNFSTYAQELSWSREYEEKGANFSWADLNRDYSAIELDNSTISDYDDPATECRYDDLLPYQYSFLTTVVKIRKVSSGDRDEDGEVITGSDYWYKGNANDKSYTVYAEIEGKDGARILTNLRVDASIYPFIEHAFWGTDNAFDCTSSTSPVGKKFKVTGYLAMYFEKFQILLCNNHADMHYIEKIA